MGTTVMTDCAVGAFTRADGAVVYVLFEETYDKRSDCREPRWEALTLGVYEQVIEQVLRLVAPCESGALEYRKGRWLPESCLRRWMKAFQAPFEMPDVSIRLEVGEAWNATIAPERAEQAMALLRGIGRADLADRLRGGPVQLQLHGDVDVVAALFGPGSSASLWRAVDLCPSGRQPRVDLAPPVRRRKVSLPAVVAYAIDRENVVVRIGDSRPVHYGWVYSSVKHYVASMAWRFELECTGAASRAITAFREACVAAQPLPANTVVKVPACWEDAPLDGLADLAVELGVAVPRELGSDLVFEFGQAGDKARAMLAGLPCGAVRWEIPPGAHPCDGPGAGTHGASQMPLF